MAISPVVVQQGVSGDFASRGIVGSEMARTLYISVIREYSHQSVPAPAIKPCGLDTLYLYLAPARFIRDFEKLRRQLPRSGQRREDFRPLGLPIILHQPDHPKLRKVQFTEVGTMDRDAIIETLGQVTDCSPFDLRVYRVDLTADIIGATSIDRFRESVKIRLKRNPVQYFNPDRSTERHEAQRREYGPCETMYFGSPKSNDFFRIYDKTAHLKKVSTASIKIPSPWVRFERSFSKSGVPVELRTLGSLLKNGAVFDPFPSVELNPCFDVTPEQIYEWKGPLNQRQNAVWALTMIRQHGRTEASRIIRREGRNPKKLFALLELILSELVIPMPTVGELTAIYQSNFKAQLFGLHASLDAAFEPDEQLAAPL